MFPYQKYEIFVFFAISQIVVFFLLYFYSVLFLLFSLAL